MRIVGTFLCIVCIVGVGFFLLQHSGIVRNPCKKTLFYSIGTFDSQFGLSKKEFLEHIEVAEAVWEDHFGKNFFEYKEGARFTINLIFDERQRQTIEEEKFRTELDGLRDAFQNIKEEHTALFERYEREATSYKELVRSYEDRLSEYNDAVSFWNKRGGAPEEEYNILQDKKTALQEEALRIESARIKLNQLVEAVNEAGMHGNSLAQEYNREAHTYRSEFGGARQFNQGEYNGKGIDIYQFDEEEHLELVLAHELGHALGIEHVGNPRSIMYYLMDEQDIDALELSLEDVVALQAECRGPFATLF